jgi:hypothetical protein
VAAAFVDLRKPPREGAAFSLSRVPHAQSVMSFTS